MSGDVSEARKLIAEKAQLRNAELAVNAAFDQGCWRRRPGSSTAAAAAASSSFAPIARAPSSPRTGISLKWKLGDGAAGDRTIVRPAAATTRQRIKSTIVPARNVGEKARRRPGRRRAAVPRQIAALTIFAVVTRARDGGYAVFQIARNCDLYPAPQVSLLQRASRACGAQEWPTREGHLAALDWRGKRRARIEISHGTVLGRA
jgi:hypothetical protein